MVPPLAGAHVVVVGLGRSGTAAALFCVGQGARVACTDDQGEGQLAPAMARLAGLPIELALGGIRPQLLLGADLIVLSPGVPRVLPALARAEAAGIPIIGEIELAARYIEAPIVGITGTNGKSTVTSLCGAIAARTSRPSFCGGNLGTPLIEAVGTPAAGPSGIVVCELSSFQLESVYTLRCAASAILNLTPDHLDRYPSMAAYGDAKARIAMNQDLSAPLVINGDDEEVLALCKRGLGRHARTLRFSLRTRPEMGGYLDGADLVLRGVLGSPASEERYPAGELQLCGMHNLGNVLAAFLLMRASGLASYDEARAAAREFRPLPHRMELVLIHEGVRYYDDSKGTNVDAVVAGLYGFPTPFALIAGGRDKGGSYAPLAEVLEKGRTRGVVLIGEAAPRIAAAMPRTVRVERAESMEEAVRRASAMCQPGDAVILSPACSSFDMFRDYAHRAQAFLDAARKLAVSSPEGSSP